MSAALEILFGFVVGLLIGALVVHVVTRAERHDRRALDGDDDCPF